LVPHRLGFDIGGLPEIDARRAACMGVLLGALVAGRSREVTPRWRLFDVLCLAPVLTFSLSYGLSNADAGMKALAHRIVALTMDWGVPYVLARAVLRDWGDLRAALRPVAICSVILAGLAVYECRMATRLTAELWNMAGLEVPIPRHATGWRWGLLRATAGFTHPLTMATVLAAMTPLMQLWRLLEPSVRWKGWVAMLACAAGCAASLSRGPMLVLGLVGIVFTIATVPRRTPILFALLALVLAASPFIFEAGRSEAKYVRTELDTRGNVESSHYRFALFLIYGEQVLEAGFLGSGDADMDLEYQHAWSVDNAYLYLFLRGGWLGGGCFLAIVFCVLYAGGGRILRGRGMHRKLLCALVASFATMAGCMANVWFAPDYAPFFFIMTALVSNQILATGSPQPTHQRSRRH
ncbi:MAG: hypothetical protein PVI86_16440, partial [Phycisphaerae bacterium]